jgi:hypothetical protein
LISELDEAIFAPVLDVPTIATELSSVLADSNKILLEGQGSIAVSSFPASSNGGGPTEPAVEIVDAVDALLGAAAAGQTIAVTNVSTIAVLAPILRSDVTECAPEKSTGYNKRGTDSRPVDECNDFFCGGGGGVDTGAGGGETGG